MEDLQGTSWLGDLVGIAANSAPIDLGSYTWYGYFKTKGGHEFHGATNFRYDNVPKDQLYGVICHRQCYQLLQTKLHYILTFEDMWPLLMEQDIDDHLNNLTYGGITKYHSQFFKTEQALLDGNAWMLKDPITDKQNEQRIVLTWKFLVKLLGKAKQCV